MRRLCLLFSLAACAADVDTADTEVGPEAGADASDPSVRAGDTTLSVSRDVTRTGDTFTLRGKTSRTLTGGQGFVLDDPYGAFATVSPRVFELTWSTTDVRSLADGVDQLIGMDFVHSSSRPDHLTGRVVVRPRLGSLTGSSKIYLTAELTPVVTDGLVVYRIAGHTTEANTDVQLRIDGTAVASVRRVDDQAFEIDLTPDQAIAATAGSDLDVFAMLATGGVEKHAHVGLSVKRLGMTSGDPEHVWPRPTCTAALKTCLSGLPGEDLAACGAAVEVQACRGQVGVVVDDAAVEATLGDADVRLAGMHDDAVGLVGSARASQFLAGAKQDVATALAELTGRWFLSTTGRSSALTGALEAGLDQAYAYPLALVPATPVMAGDAAAMRNVAADAVLTQIAAMDFVHSEFDRSLVALAHEFRAQHVASIRAFRETIAAEPYPGSTVWDVYIGDWLGAHTEVTIERASGAVISTLVELD